jgi:hypothetical protein
MKAHAIFALTLVVALFGPPAAEADEGCVPVDIAAVDPSSLPGRKAWIWAEDVGMMVRSAKGFASAPTMKQNGPISWYPDYEATIPYGEPAEIVKYEPVYQGWARVTVKLQDGREVVVPGPTIHLYEFWHCTARQLMQERRVPTKDGKYPFNETVQWTHGVWVRLVDKTIPVEKSSRWMDPAEVARIELLYCNKVWGSIQSAPAGQYDLSCQPVTPSGLGGGITLDPKAVETVSPTSMKILLGS